MKKLILIVGELAAGKSTLAQQIAARYGVLAVTKDRLKELLCDTFGYETRLENLKLSFASFDLMLHLFYRSAEAQTPLVLESNFRQSELDRLKTAADQCGYETLTLSLGGDLHVLHQRFLDRIASGTRHTAHLAQDLTAFEDFKAISFSENPRTLFGTILALDTTKEGAPKDYSSDARIRAFLNDSE